MKYGKLGSLAVFCLLLFACSSENDNDNPQGQDGDGFDRKAMLVNWADNIIIPAYTDFSEKANTLNQETENFTGNPSEANLQNLREAWKTAYLSFQNVSMFEIGKAEEVMFREKMNIYPTDAPAIDQNSSNGNYDLDAPSAKAQQGFPALDYMLNGLGETDAETLQFYTTNANAEGYGNYLNKLAQRISDLSTQVLNDWTTSYRDKFVNNTGNSASGAVNKMANAYILYYEKALRSGKIGIPAGEFSSGPLPEKVEGYYQKDFSKQLFVQGLKASQDFFNGKAFNSSNTGESFKTYLEYLNTTKNDENLADLIDDQFDTAKNKASELDGDFTQQINTDNSKMLNTFDELQRNVVLLKVDMVQAMNIDVDYYDADGD